MLHASACQRSPVSCRPCSTRWLSQHLLRLIQQGIEPHAPPHLRPRLGYPRRSTANPRAQFIQVWVTLPAERRFTVLELLLTTIDSSVERDRLLAALAQTLAQTAI
jgi:hypothetical protein